MTAPLILTCPKAKPKEKAKAKIRKVKEKASAKAGTKVKEKDITKAIPKDMLTKLILNGPWGGQTHPRTMQMHFTMSIPSTTGQAAGHQSPVP